MAWLKKVCCLFINLMLGKLLNFFTDLPRVAYKMVAYKRKYVYFMSTSIISHLFKIVRLTKQEDITDEIKQSKIVKNANEVEKIVSFIDESLNFFSHTLEYHLLDISTGRATDEETSIFLLNFLRIEEGKIILFI